MTAGVEMGCAGIREVVDASAYGIPALAIKKTAASKSTLIKIVKGNCFIPSTSTFPTNHYDPQQQLRVSFPCLN